jgi:hypothetical protein
LTADWRRVNSITTDEAEEQVGPRAARVLGLSVIRDEDGLILELRFRGHDQGEVATLRFTRVQELRVQSDCLDLAQIVYLVSTDIRSRRWETVRYQVRDLENSMSFYCSTIETC